MAQNIPEISYCHSGDSSADLERHPVRGGCGTPSAERSARARRDRRTHRTTMTPRVVTRRYATARRDAPSATRSEAARGSGRREEGGSQGRRTKSCR